jgi:hypothetical protein
LEWLINCLGALCPNTDHGVVICVGVGSVI